VIVVVEFDYVDVVFCFFVDELRHPPFRLIISGLRLPKTRWFLRELSQSCVKDVFVGLYPPPKSENPACCRSPVLCRIFSSPLWMVAGKMRTPPW
jgi:hypothetical protein